MSKEQANRESRGTLKTQMRYLHPNLVYHLVPQTYDPLFAPMHVYIRGSIHAHIQRIKLAQTTAEWGAVGMLSELREQCPAMALLEGCSRGMVAGAMKYEPWNFLKGFTVNDIMDSLERHYIQYTLDPQSIDEDTTERLRNGCTRLDGTVMPGFPDAPAILHRDLICTNINMILWCGSVGRLWDDRGVTIYPAEEKK